MIKKFIFSDFLETNIFYKNKKVNKIVRKNLIFNDFSDIMTDK